MDALFPGDVEAIVGFYLVQRSDVGLDAIVEDAVLVNGTELHKVDDLKLRNTTFVRLRWALVGIGVFS